MSRYEQNVDYTTACATARQSIEAATPGALPREHSCQCETWKCSQPCEHCRGRVCSFMLPAGPHAICSYACRRCRIRLPSIAACNSQARERVPALCKCTIHSQTCQLAELKNEKKDSESVHLFLNCFFSAANQSQPIFYLMPAHAPRSIDVDQDPSIVWRVQQKTCNERTN
jgi:hypothetical protein